MSEEKVKCILCNKIILEDDFPEHAVDCHLDIVLDLIDDEDIIERLSEGVIEE